MPPSIGRSAMKTQPREVTMLFATFDKLSDFLEELKIVVRKRGTENIIVRRQIETINGNDGTQHVHVRTGFHDDSYFYEGYVFCGQEPINSRSHSRDATDCGEKMLKEILDVCQELHVECRGGRWQVPG